MTKVEVGDGWAAIVLNIIVVGSFYPQAWNFRLHRAWRNSGRLRLHVTTDSDDPKSLEATAALSQIAWHRSSLTCEICGRGGHLRLGRRYALTLCRDHEYLVGERHPDDGRIPDPWTRHEGAGVLPEGYDDPDVMKDDLLNMWSCGKTDIRDVMEILRLSRAEIMSAALEAGYRLHLEDDDADEKGTEIARLIAAAGNDGTRH